MFVLKYRDTDRDETGHYRLAIEEGFVDDLEAISPVSGASLLGPSVAALIDRYGKVLRLPVGSYRPVPQARRFHRSKAQYRWCLGGNRSSKSHALCHEVFWFATGSHLWRDIETPNIGWYATQTWEMVGTILWPKLKKLLEGWDYETSWHNKRDDIPRSVSIAVPGGRSLIRFKAYEQGEGAFQGTEQRYVAFDEQFERPVYVEAVTRIGAGQPLDFMAAMTPIQSQPWLEEKLTGTDVPRNTEIFEFPLDDNRCSHGGFIPDDRIDSIIAEWPPEVRETRRNGKWGSFLGTIYTTFSRDIHVVGEAKENRLFWLGDSMPPHFVTTGAIDWGGANPFVFLFATRIPHLDNEWYIYDEYYYNPREQGSRRLEQHAQEILGRKNKWGTSFDRIWADWDPTDAYELGQYGVESQPADKEVRAGIEWVQTLLNPREAFKNTHFERGRPRLHIAARCKNLLRELPSYKWSQSASPDKKDPRDEPVKVNDHSCDALRYLLFSERPYEEGGGLMPVGTLGNEFRRTF